MIRPFALRWLLWRGRRPYVRPHRDGPLLVLPGVLDPVATKVGTWLAAQVAAEARPGERWVDMGSGSGVVGLALARAGAVVTSVDIDPVAVRNTRVNAALHELPIEVVQSDLFAALSTRRFDKVAYNVPFWRGDPDGRPFGRAMYAGEGFEAIHAFVRVFREHAEEARVVLSERGDGFPAARDALGEARLLVRERWRGEWLDLFAL